MERRLYIGALLVAIGCFVGLYALRNQGGADAVTEQSVTVTKPAGDKQAAAPQKTFDTKQFSLSDPASPWVVVNKKRPLQPADYTPASLVVPNVQLRSNITSDERQVAEVTARALETLVGEAKKQDVQFTLESGYRSYNFQVNLYNRYVSQQGKAVADTQSARAGYSEHQTGLAADLGGVTRPACNVEACYAETPEGKWLQTNAYSYGFIIRYPEGKTPITGYTYEPWHLRYVGTELAGEMHKKGIATLEEFFELPAAPDYN